MTSAARARLRCRPSGSGEAAHATEATDALLPRFDDTGHWTTAVVPFTMPSEPNAARTVVRRCVHDLPESFRTILLLRDAAGLEEADAAALLGATVGASRHRLHEARQVFHALLARAASSDAPPCDRPPPERALGLTVS